MVHGEVLEHITRRVESAPLARQPFPHLVIEDLLPEDAYEELLARWPPREHFEVNASRQRWDARVDRLVPKLPVAERPFWAALSEWVHAANRVILRRLTPYFGIKFQPYLGDDWKRRIDGLTVLNRGAQLAYYTGVAALAPHVDHPLIVSNAFVYCSEKDAVEPDLGTVLYRSHGLMVPSNLPLPESFVRKGLRRQTVVPYGRNLCFAYLNAPVSFHGVEPRDIGSRERRLLMFGNLLTQTDGLALFGEELMT